MVVSCRTSGYHSRAHGAGACTCAGRQGPTWSSLSATTTPLHQHKKHSIDPTLRLLMTDYATEGAWCCVDISSRTK